MKRTDHPRVAKWLENFTPAKRETAMLLVDGLRLVSSTDLRRELGNLIADLAARLPGPVAAFPAREVLQGKSPHTEGRDGGYSIIEPALPGSEAVIANVIRGVQRQPASASAILPALDLPLIRETRAPTILLVDDFSGSGSQILKFDRGLSRHATIRSWTSGGFLSVHVAAYAATEKAIARLRRRFGDRNVHILHACPTFAGAGWTPEQLAEVEALCRGGHPRPGGSKRGRLSKRNRSRKIDWTFGFENSRALIAFEHTAPNNMPQVLWKVSDGWNSLFEYKAVPRELLSLFPMRPGPPQEPHLGAEGAKRLGAIIELIAHRVKRPEQIAETVDVSIAEANRLLALARSLNLVGASGRLTDAGMVELKRRRAFHPTSVLPNHNDPYYPMQLRAER